jgi:hypothetical protein
MLFEMLDRLCRVGSLVAPLEPLGELEGRGEEGGDPVSLIGGIGLAGM